MKAFIGLFLVLALSASGVAAQTAANQATLTSDNHIDTVDVTAPKVPLDQAVHSFVNSYVHPTETAGKIARWTSKIPLCPDAVGLSPALNVFVVERIRTVASMVGAPTNLTSPCNDNVVVWFTQHPQDIIDYIAKNNEDLLGYHEISQKKKLATMSYPIQAWYETATRDNNGGLHTDRAWQDPECTVAMQELDSAIIAYGTGVYATQPFLLQRVLQTCGGASVTGNRVLDGLRGEIGEVTILVDTNKIIGMPLGAVSDYIAMLALSQTKAFLTCQTLTSITNLMTPNCEAQKAQTLTEADIAYLKAIYKTDPNVIGSIQTTEIVRQMETELGTH